MPDSLSRRTLLTTGITGISAFASGVTGCTAPTTHAGQQEQHHNDTEPLHRERRLARTTLLPFVTYAAGGMSEIDGDGWNQLPVHG